MNYCTNKSLLLLAGLMAMGLSACKDNDPDVSGQGNVEDAEYVGKSVGNFSADEWYPGGKLGTTDNVTAGCYEDETPVVVDNEKLELAFKLGEAVFERNFTDNTAPFKGLGPAYLRSSCIDCHPGYGHGKRQTSYPSTDGHAANPRQCTLPAACRRQSNKNRVEARQRHGVGSANEVPRWRNLRPYLS